MDQYLDPQSPMVVGSYRLMVVPWTETWPGQGDTDKEDNDPVKQ